MSFNLLDGAKALFSSDIVKAAAGQFGESDTLVSKAMSGIVPGLLGGLIGKAESPGGAETIFNMIKGATNTFGDASPTALLGNSSMLEQGWGLVKNLFGSQSDNFLSKLAGFSGGKVSTITSLLGFAAPMILRWIGGQVSSKGLNASSLLDIFKGQKQSIMSAVPGDLNLGSVFSNAFSAPSSSSAPRATYEEPASSGGGNKWLLPLLLLLGLGALLWWWLGRDKGETATETVQVTTPEPAAEVTTVDPAALGIFDSVANRFVYNVGALGDITLPDGSKLNVGANSTEAKLFNFLNDNNVSVNTEDKTKGWISLDRVYFETNKNTLTAESVGQLRNIAAILKAFPNASVKFGGYTDNTGDEAANMKLSADRALAAMNEIAGLGIDKARLASEGYGSQWPLASNETAAGRALNRRVDVRVTSK